MRSGGDWSGRGVASASSDSARLDDWGCSADSGDSSNWDSSGNSATGIVGIGDWNMGSDWNRGGDWSSGEDWSGPSWRIRSQAGWAARRSLDDDLNWLDSESGELGNSLALNPFESVVFHDEQSHLGHRLGQDVSAVDVDSVVPGDGWSRGNCHVFFFDNLLDDFSGDVLDLGSSLDHLSSSSEVETV